MSLFGAVGDHAPPIPSTYLTSHPRLGPPDTTYLNAVWTARASGRPTGSKYIFDDANAWTGVSGETYVDCRYLLIAYLSDKLNSGPNHSAYLTSLKAQSRSAWGVGNFSGSFCMALTYDWIYVDLGSAAQAGFLADLQAYSGDWESGLASVSPSPYNDVAYIDGVLLGLPVAIAQYPDGGATSLAHLRYAMDYTFNMQVPVWKQLFGPLGAGGTDTSTDGTGCWHETWEYINASDNFGLMQHMGPILLSWARATNNYPGLFTTTYPWFKNIGYCTMYQTRPDMTLERINGSANGGWLSPEYDGRSGATLGTLELLGSAYNDPTLRGWARLVDWGNTAPSGFEPAAFPYASPDSSSNTANTRAGANSGAGLPLVRNFPTFGTGFRTGWGESDTFAFIRCSDNYWSHDIQDQGSFTIYSRGALAIRSGSYQPGSASPHYYLYGKQAISQNTVLVNDPADVYSSETVAVYHNDGTNTNVPMPNDGGQRRVGSGFNLASSLSQVMQSPYDLPMWQRAREIYHGCAQVGFTANAGYSYVAMDLTSAYNNLYSLTAHSASSVYDQANTTNRTYRVQSYVRHLIWIPRGPAAYVVVYDQVTSTNSAFPKTWVMHTIEQPTVSGNHFTVTRNRSATLSPVNFCSSSYGYGLTYCGTGAYTYAGQLDGWMTLPAIASSATACVLGGASHEFDIGATTNSSCTVTYGTNYNECMQDQCSAGLGIGSTTGYIVPDQTIGGSEPGAWRIEEKPGLAAARDTFINVMLARNVSDTNAVSTAPSTSTSGSNYVTTWKDNGDTCTYTLTLPINGVGGSLTAVGAGCATVI